MHYFDESLKTTNGPNMTLTGTTTALSDINMTDQDTPKNTIQSTDDLNFSMVTKVVVNKPLD